MYRLSARQKAVLAKKIRHYKELHFPGKGSGARLAMEIGVPPQTVSNWLSGSRQPTPPQLYRLAVAFKVSPLELCGFRKEKAPPPKAAEASILHDMATMMRDSGKGGANTRVTAKALRDFKDFLEEALAELWRQGKEHKM